MEQCRNLVQPEKLIVLIPFGRRRYDQFCAEVEGLFPCRLPEYNGRRVGETTIHAVLYFDSDWTPHLEPAVRETYLSYYSGRFAAKLEGDSIFVREQSHLHCILDNLLRPIIERSAHPARRMKSKAARS